ncbi:hypothetical protein VPH35_095666 [Triticum aestivum]
MLRCISRLGLFWLCLCLCYVTLSAAQPLVRSFRLPVVPHDHLRAADVRRQCRSVLSSAAQPTADGPVVHDLHFANGDWHQDGGHVPLMLSPGVAGPDPELLQQATPLATFTLTHADDTAQRRRHARRSLKVSGVLSLTITRNRCSSDGKSEMMDDPHHDLCRSPEFNLLPCVAKLSVVLEGIYTETGDDGGGGDRTLTTRAVHGKMMSTRAKSDDVYFDTVRLVSQFGGPYASNRFRHSRRSRLGAASFPCYVTTTATTATSRVDVQGNCTKTSLFCDILLLQWTRTVPNWNYDSTEEFCSGLGPFVVNTTNMAFTDFAILMQALRCGTTSGLDGKAVVLVTALFRVVPPWEDREMAVKHAGLSDMTLSAEGVPYISMYVPTTRRDILMGQITSMDGSHFPLSCRRGLHPREGCNKVGRPDEWLRMTYNYKKVGQAMELLRRTKTSRISSKLVSMSPISYPRKRAGHDDTASLSEDLHLRFRAGPEWIMKGGQSSERFFELQIISIGPLVGYVPQPSMSVAQDQDGMGDHGVERQELLNVSAAFTVSESFFGPRSVMSLEGVYNPEDGRMHLVGCQGVEAPWQIMSKMRGLRNSSIELEVQYPPTRMRWLFSPSAKVHLSSTRATGDPLYFNRTELLEHPSYYAREMSNRFMEQKGVVCLAMLSATIAAALRQLSYMESHPDTVPYISLAMLGAQALCYGAALVTDASILLAWRRTSDGDGNYRMQVRGLHWDMDCSVKALALAALLLTLRLAHKVRRSRVQDGVTMGLYPKAGGVVVLALLVYVQQRWNYRILGWAVVDKEKNKLQHVY